MLLTDLWDQHAANHQALLRLTDAQQMRAMTMTADIATMADALVRLANDIQLAHLAEAARRRPKVSPIRPVLIGKWGGPVARRRRDQIHQALRGG